ncbi:class III extradiol ring-cleavage dioxygenase [Neobacillus sp. PS3-40]|uniref:DODA-type extradiol aromatic ring-opening family dioxygenase n=1 Tax=Neobacillus sp. PS3-40 TaxID=3070679 RepID=UPI0027DFD783|nr:class III extradiol ring-cleavage dioxygenase [Neobacillus sp. PS3-40]WML45796.1 class III extradiol ring-cleavage dioxygenase [Neobacillus sp. PS3-40]
MVPSLFLAHGSPMLALEETDYTRFLEKLGKQIKPKAIVIFTAHWEKENVTISSINETYDTIYDFHGFPNELYEINYPAKGSVKIATMIQDQFQQAGIQAELDSNRGLDHGSWTLLYKMYPQATIPVVQVSINPFLNPEQQFQLGRIVKDLGGQDILVIGSGVTVHNLRVIKWGQTEPEQWAMDFDDWLVDKIKKRDLVSLFDYDKLAPHAKLAVPRPEHFVPLFIAMGSSNGLEEPKVIHRSYDLGSLSYLCFQF